MSTATKAAESSAPFPHRHLLGIGHLSASEINQLLGQAETYRAHIERGAKRLNTLDGATVVNLFFENSTRTRTSFEMAAQHLGAYVVNFDVNTSSVKKGESLNDTIETIEAAGANFIVMRHSASGAHQYVARHAKASLLNAGDGWHAHPTQALLDAFTMKRALGQVEGLKVTIVGDVLHSRVARSNILCLTALGADVTVCGPRMFVPDSLKTFGVKISHSLDEGIKGADVIYLLRIQLERQAANRFPSLREYRKLYGIDQTRLRNANPEALVMHPGPVNRGVEITNAVMDRERTVVIDQVANGVPVRMACFKMLKSAVDGVPVHEIEENTFADAQPITARSLGGVVGGVQTLGQEVGTHA